MPPPTNNPAPTTDFNTAVGEVASTYDPEQQQAEQGVTAAQQSAWQQQSQLLQDKNTSLSSLDQAKANAFADNSLTANNRGLFFSGYTPAQNDAYTTNTYNPKVADVNTTYNRNLQTSQDNFTNTRQSLLDKISQINQDRSNAAESIVQNTQQAQAAAAAKAAAADKSGNANYVQGSKGQYMFVDQNGKGINLQQYVTNTGGDINTVLGLLQNGTTYDKNIYNKVVAAKPANATAALNLISQLSQKANASGTGSSSVYGF